MVVVHKPVKVNRIGVSGRSAAGHFGGLLGPCNQPLLQLSLQQPHRTLSLRSAPTT